MRLKLSGPDYKDQDPVTALADFKKRVSLYEKAYVPVGEYEERNSVYLFHWFRAPFLFKLVFEFQGMIPRFVDA